MSDFLYTLKNLNSFLDFLEIFGTAALVGLA